MVSRVGVGVGGCWGRVGIASGRVGGCWAGRVVPTGAGLCDEFCVGQTFAHHSHHDLFHLLEGVQHAHIRAAGELVHIAVPVFFRHFVVGAVDAAFEQWPERFDAVGVNLAAYVFPG